MPPTDEAFAALLDDIGQRGLLADTLMVCMSEFGRTPLINKQGGRDHWSEVQSVVFAGAGIHGGSIYGTSDRHGATPADKQGLLHQVGRIDLAAEPRVEVAAGQEAQVVPEALRVVHAAPYK
jgi:hypothetical protein